VTQLLLIIITSKAKLCNYLTIFIYRFWTKIVSFIIIL